MDIYFHFNWLGWIAVAAGLLSIAVARMVRVNDTGAPSPLANLEAKHNRRAKGAWNQVPSFALFLSWRPLPAFAEASAV